MSVSVANTDANLSAKTIVLAERDTTVTGAVTFSRSPSAPFIVTASSAVVPNLDADKLDGLDSTAFALVATGVDYFASHGRLTLTTATPVTTADVTAATTLYYTPYTGDYMGVYSGSAWSLLAFSEISIAIPATTSQMYDVFVYNNSGTLALELLAWTNDTTRATALVRQNGIWMKTGALTRRYVGSVRTTTVSGQTEDSAVKRYLWNAYNRVPRFLRRQDTTTSWTYTTATVRQANAATANQLDLIVGLNEQPVDVSVQAIVSHSTGTITASGIGLDSTTAFATGMTGGAQSCAAGLQIINTARWIGYPGIGRHTLPWLEWSTATGVATWYGTDVSLTNSSSGISGWMNG